MDEHVKGNEELDVYPRGRGTASPDGEGGVWTGSRGGK